MTNVLSLIVMTVALSPEQIRGPEILQFFERSADLRQDVVLVVLFRQRLELGVDVAKLRLVLAEPLLRPFEFFAQRRFVRTI